MTRKLPISFAVLLLSASLASAQATQPTSQNYLRFVPDPQGGGTLQTATVTMRHPGDGRTIDLIAAVHVADPRYYADLEKSFKSYDALLYEMVKPEGMAPPAKGAKTSGAVTGIQRFLKNVLDLQYQLDAIDYSAKNFVHADLDAQTFYAKEDQRGESLSGLMLQSMLREMAKDDSGGAQGDVQLGSLLMALTAPDRAKQLKLVLARQFNDIEDTLAGLGGPDGSVILTERNKKAFSVIQQQFAAGKKHLGLFYGAAHLADMQQRLAAIGFKPVATKWRIAWDMSGPPATRPASAFPFDQPSSTQAPQ